jgi:hypothetical protein
MKLAKLPERTRMRLIVQVSADLQDRLTAYAELYEKTYCNREEIAALVPFMIEAFLDDDKSFGKPAKKSNRNALTSSTKKTPENQA